LACGHKAKDLIVVDVVREIPAPFDPENVVEEFSKVLRSYNIRRVTGDRYAGEWPREQFRKRGIEYTPSELNKSALYVDLLPRLNSQTIRLVENARLVNQLVGLERRTARGGRDSIDHAPGAHDDLANAVAGLAAAAAGGKYRYDSSLDWVSGPDPDKDFQRQRLAQHILRTSGYYRQWR